MLFPLYDHNPHRRFPLITLLLIVVNVGVMWKVSLLSPPQRAEVSFEWGFIPARLTRIDNPEPLRIREVLRQPELPGRKPQPERRIELDLPNDALTVYATFFTTLFLHGGWLHLITNMWMLWVFGNNIEDRLGHIVYGLFYIAGGTVATLSHWMIDPESTVPMIGASGAVAAVLGAYALTYPSAKVRTLVFIGIPLLLDIPALIVLGLWMLAETFAGLLEVHLGMAGGVAHWAHIGGFVAGLVLMPLLALGRPPDGEDWQKEADSQFKFEDPKPLTERE